MEIKSGPRLELWERGQSSPIKRRGRIGRQFEMMTVRKIWLYKISVSTTKTENPESDTQRELVRQKKKCEGNLSWKTMRS